MRTKNIVMNQKQKNEDLVFFCLFPVIFIYIYFVLSSLITLNEILLPV